MDRRFCLQSVRREAERQSDSKREMGERECERNREIVRANEMSENKENFSFVPLLHMVESLLSEIDNRHEEQKKKKLIFLKKRKKKLLNRQ